MPRKNEILTQELTFEDDYTCINLIPEDEKERRNPESLPTALQKECSAKDIQKVRGSDYTTKLEDDNAEFVAQQLARYGSLYLASKNIFKEIYPNSKVKNASSYLDTLKSNIEKDLSPILVRRNYLLLRKNINLLKVEKEPELRERMSASNLIEKDEMLHMLAYEIRTNKSENPSSKRIRHEQMKIYAELQGWLKDVKPLGTPVTLNFGFINQTKTVEKNITPKISSVTPLTDEETKDLPTFTIKR